MSKEIKRHLIIREQPLLHRLSSVIRQMTPITAASAEPNGERIEVARGVVLADGTSIRSKKLTLPESPGGEKVDIFEISVCREQGSLTFGISESGLRGLQICFPFLYLGDVLLDWIPPSIYENWRLSDLGGKDQEILHQTSFTLVDWLSEMIGRGQFVDSPFTFTPLA